MSAMSHAERQKRYRERQSVTRDSSHTILLKILEELRSLRDLVTKSHASRDIPPHPPSYESKSSTETLSESATTPQRRGTRLPADFVVPREWKDEARLLRERDGLPAINLDAEAEHFGDFWRAKAGKDGCKLDWHATWRNWCRNARGSKPAAVNGHTNGLAIRTPSSKCLWPVCSCQARSQCPFGRYNGELHVG